MNVFVGHHIMRNSEAVKAVIEFMLLVPVNLETIGNYEYQEAASTRSMILAARKALISCWTRKVHYYVQRLFFDSVARTSVAH